MAGVRGSPGTGRVRLHFSSRRSIPKIAARSRCAHADESGQRHDLAHADIERDVAEDAFTGQPLDCERDITRGGRRFGNSASRSRPTIER